MVGLAPTRVSVPPMMAQKPIGMRIRDGTTPTRLDTRSAAGRKRAAAPMFCIMLEITPTVPEMRIMMRFSLAPASLMMGPATWFITPVLSRPAPMMMTAMIEQTALLLSPTKACLGAMRPSIGSRTIIRTPTTSTLIHSETNSHTAKARTTIVSIISGVMPVLSVYSAGVSILRPASTNSASSCSLFGTRSRSRRPG